MTEGTWTIEPCARDSVGMLARELELSPTTAAVLVRRGYEDVVGAEAFLEGALPADDPFGLGDMAEACEAIRDSIAGHRRICVHGDYDADGICATALAVLILRELGAEVEWHLPSRFEEGYGVRGETLSRLAGDGCGLVLTVDCGITATAEVAAAKELGLSVVVSDHHRPAEELPDCPLLCRHTRAERDKGTEPPHSGAHDRAPSNSVAEFHGRCRQNVDHDRRKGRRPRRTRERRWF